MKKESYPILETEVRSQRGADSWGGKLPDFVQCYYTSACVLLSHWIDGACSDEYYKSYVDDVETQVGRAGIGEKIAAKFSLKGRSGMWAVVHQAALQERLKDKIVSFSTTLTAESIRGIIDKGSPVVLNTMLTHSGHVVCVIGYTAEGFWVVDPWGDASKNYVVTKPGPHVYPFEMFDKRCRASDGNFWGTYAL